MQYAILGGGALGLGAAYRLTQAGHSVMVFEQETTAGGLASGFQIGDAWLEKFYHHLFRTDTTAIKLIQELGLGDRLEWSHPRTVCLIGGKVLLGTRVEKAEPIDDDHWEIQTNNGTWTADRVISTMATRLTCRLIPALPDDYRARYNWGQAYGAQCLILSLDRQLTDSYWINPCDPGYPFTSLVEHTNYQPPSEYGGRHLIYLGNYRPMDDPLFKMHKDAILQEFLPHLKRVNPAFDPDWIQESWLFQAPFAQPIVTKDYREHIPPLRTPLKGLWVANMFQVYPHDRGQNYSFELADRLVQELETQKEQDS